MRGRKEKFLLVIVFLCIIWYDMNWVDTVYPISDIEIGGQCNDKYTGMGLCGGYDKS